MSCGGLIDEARVTVDVTLLERAALNAPLLAVALVLSLVGLGLAVRAAPAGHRAWSFFALLAPAGALLGKWYLLQVPSGLSFACVLEPSRTAGKHVAIAGGLAALCLLQLGVTLWLRAWKREVRALWPVALLSSALALSLGVGLHKAALVREFGWRVRAVTPLPNVRPPQAPPEAHVGRALTFKPMVEAAGYEVGFIFRERVALTDEDRRAWGIDTVTLTPEAEGLSQVPIHLERDLLAVDAELEVRGVRDEGPAWFPLAVGNRWEFVAVQGRGGTLDRLRTALERGRKPVPAASLVLEVTGEGERDGFHFFELTESGKDLAPKVLEVVRRDGVVFSGERRIAYTGEAHCVVGLLEPSWCACTPERLTQCTVVHGDLGETLLRLFLGAVTLGITELNGMGDLGAGNEAGLLLTRWVVSGERLALSPPSPPRGAKNQ